MSLLKRLWTHHLVRNIVMLYGVQLSSYILPLVVLPYLARVLSTERFGVIALAQSFMYYFLVLTDYGFGLTATREIAIHSDDHAAVSRIFSRVMMARVLLMAVGFVVMLGVVLATPKMRPNWILFVICYLGVLGNVLFPLWLYQGMQKMQHIAVRDLSAKALALAAIFIFVHSDRDYLLAAALQPAGMVVSGLVSLIMLRRVMPVRFEWTPWREIWGELRQSWPVFLSLAANTTYTSTNAVLLGLIAPPATLAYYYNAYRITGAIRSLVSPLVTAVYPHVSQIASRSGKDGMRFLKRYAMLLCLPFLLVSIGLFVLAPFIVKVLFGPKYAYTAVLLRILAPGPFLFALSHCYSTYFMLAFGYQKQWSRLILFTAIANFVLLVPFLWLMPPAAAFASVGIGVDAFSFVMSYFFYRRHVHEHEHDRPAQPQDAIPQP
ncbi:MAG TPA: flippase [Bryobacteraceae bacterium]|jgi:PST family polysaccharide transporter|nr:flippase [Bryobacteraceae bacterium]